MRGVLFGFQRHSYLNDGPAAWLRIDGNLSVHRLQSLLHAWKSQTTTYHSFFGVKASPFVTHGQFYGRFGSAEAAPSGARTRISRPTHRSRLINEGRLMFCPVR